MPTEITIHNPTSVYDTADIDLFLRVMLRMQARPWSMNEQQIAFERAMELYHRRNATLAHRRTARRVLRRLVEEYNRTWTHPAPSVSRFRRNNYLSEINSQFNSNRSPSSNRSNPYSNNNTGLHSLFINTKLVKLPANKPIDPISHHTFKKGDVATRISQNGKNTYFRTGSFNRWFGHNWKHMNANSNAKISDKEHPLTRANVIRKNVSRVRFV